MLPNIQGLNIPRPEAESTPTDIFVVSEDEPGEWRVVEQDKEEVFGPFDNELAALRAAFHAVHFGHRWEIHVLDQLGTRTSTSSSELDPTPGKNA